MNSLLYIIIIGAVCGWLAGNLMKGGGFGLVVNIILGIVGGFVGKFLLGSVLAITSTVWINDVITGVIGTVIVLFVAGLFKK